MIPSRISELIRWIEEGKPVTQADVDRLASLQALDLAQAGEKFLALSLERERTKREQA